MIVSVVTRRTGEAALSYLRVSSTAMHLLLTESESAANQARASMERGFEIKLIQDISIPHAEINLQTKTTLFFSEVAPASNVFCDVSSICHFAWAHLPEVPVPTTVSCPLSFR